MKKIRRQLYSASSSTDEEASEALESQEAFSSSVSSSNDGNVNGSKWKFIGISANLIRTFRGGFDADEVDFVAAADFAAAAAVLFTGCTGFGAAAVVAA